MPKSTEDLIELVNEQHREIMAAHAKSAKEIAVLEVQLRDVEQQAARPWDGSGAEKSWGSQVAQSDAYTKFTSELGMKGRVGLEVKASLTTGGSSVGPMIVPDRRTEVVGLPHQRLTIRDLLAPGRTTSNLVEYPRQLTYTNNAGVVSEGAQKPESDMTFELANAPVRVIAHWIPVSRQAMADATQLQSLIDSEMRYGLALAEEQELLYGTGLGEHLHGLIPQATAFSKPFNVTFESQLDNLLQGIAQVQLTKLPATGIVVNNTDWAQMQAIKDGQGRYVGSGPFGAQPAVAWTLPVVATPSIAQGNFLVGNFQLAAQIFDRADPQIFLSDSHSDFFIKNMLAVLCEERLALAVKRPYALVYGTLDVTT